MQCDASSILDWLEVRQIEEGNGQSRSFQFLLGLHNLWDRFMSYTHIYVAYIPNYVAYIPNYVAFMWTYDIVFGLIYANQAENGNDMGSPAYELLMCNLSRP